MLFRSYTTAWALFAIQRVISYEAIVMPARVVWLRVVVSIPVPFLAAFGAMLIGLAFLAASLAGKRRV